MALTTVQKRIRERFGWRKVQAPTVWRPRIGEELIGYFGGRTLRNGQHGQYEVALVHVPHTGSFTVSGSALIRLIDAAGVGKGHPVRVVFKGTKSTQNNHTEKQFDLLVADLESIAPEDLPEIEIDGDEAPPVSS